MYHAGDGVPLRFSPRYDAADHNSWWVGASLMYSRRASMCERKWLCVAATKKQQCVGHISTGLNNNKSMQCNALQAGLCVQYMW